MNILSLDTAMGACSVAVIDTENSLTLAECCVPMERGHAEALAPMVRKVMAVSELRLDEIHRIAVTTGPGTFTGIRIGLAFAQGLARSCCIPVVGIDCLSAIAANETAKAPLLVASKAGNGQVYTAILGETREVIKPPRIATPAEAARSIPPDCIVMGTGAEAVIAASSQHDFSLSKAQNYPIAARFARLTERLPTDEPLRPLYLRQPDAKPQTASPHRVDGVMIERATTLHAALLSELHGESFEKGWSSKEFEEMLQIPGTSALTLMDFGRPVALLMTRQTGDEAEIITIGTRFADRQRGFAHQLLSQHLETLARQQIRRIFLEVAETNIAAQSLYQKLGFGEIGRRPGYYGRGTTIEDAIVLSKVLAGQMA